MRGRRMSAMPNPVAMLLIVPLIVAGQGFQGTLRADPLEAPAPASVRVFIGASRVRLDNGRTLAGIDTGVLDVAPGHGGFASLITWRDGGQISLRGMLGTRTTKGKYAGTACGVQ